MNPDEFNRMPPPPPPMPEGPPTELFDPEIAAQAQRIKKRRMETAPDYIVQEYNDAYDINDEIKKRDAVIKKAFTALLCLGISLSLNVMSFHVPYTPWIVVIELSVVPLLYCAVSAGPLFAALAILLKNGIYLFINHGAYPSVPNKVVLEFIYVMIAYIIYYILYKRLLKSRVHELDELSDKEDTAYKSKYMLIGGILAGLVAAPMSLVTMKYIMLPLLYTVPGYDDMIILGYYQYPMGQIAESFPGLSALLPNVNSIRSGALLFNLPLNFAKYFASALLASGSYYLISTYSKKL